MPSFNKVILVGHLTRDPEIRAVNDTHVCDCGIAVNHKYKEKEEVSFFDIVLWGKQAEVFAQYMVKGRPVLVEGRLKQERWENKEGEKRSKVRVVAERFVFLGAKADGEPAAKQVGPVTEDVGEGTPSEDVGEGTPSEDVGGFDSPGAVSF